MFRHLNLQASLHNHLVVPKHHGSVAEHAAYCYFQAFFHHQQFMSFYVFNPGRAYHTKIMFIKHMLECKETTAILTEHFSELVKIIDPVSVQTFLHQLCFSLNENKTQTTKQDDAVRKQMFNVMKAGLGNTPLTTFPLAIKKEPLTQESKKLPQEIKTESVTEKPIATLFKSKEEETTKENQEMETAAVAMELLSLFL